MVLQGIMLALGGIEKIGELENQRIFKDAVIEVLQSLMDQINLINHNQMEQINAAFTRMEWIQYGLIFTLAVITILFASIYRSLLLRIKALELKNK